MTSKDSKASDGEWRSEMVALIANGSLEEAANALVSLAFNDADGAWVEGVLLSCLDGDSHSELKLLSLTCIGHLARIHGTIQNPRTIMRVKQMAKVSGFEGRAQDALDDFEVYLGMRLYSK
ncbi:hypothetical protein [Stackebrandtia soli]|uniref:hypothetical protein n=1 Tax=Stackebrandtia soli TaxID=1892856 RepID=UPI0039E87965